MKKKAYKDIKTKIYNSLIINHPNGDCSLGEIQKDVTAWTAMQGNDTFGFTSKTVQALIDTIISLRIELLHKECDATKSDIY